MQNASTWTSPGPRSKYPLETMAVTCCTARLGWAEILRFLITWFWKNGI